MKEKNKKLLSVILVLFMVVGLVPQMTLTAWAEDGAESDEHCHIELGEASVSGNTYYYPSTVVTGSGIKSILISFSKSVTEGDKIILPDAAGFSGFAVSETSLGNDYVKRISLDGKTAEEVQEYLRNVGFKISSESQSVQIAVTTERIEYDTYYNIDTEHYYQFIPIEKKWTEAYDVAKEMTYMGRTGYLATVMSKDEDIFINSLSGGKTGWLGGSILKPVGTPVDSKNGTDDALMYYSKFNTEQATDGWYWVCGPEVGTKFYESTGVTNNTVEEIDKQSADLGEYYNWAYRSNESEPNTVVQVSGPINVNGKDGECCLSTLNISDYGYEGKQGTLFSWNDLANNEGNGGPWDAKGYFVEYGNRHIGDDGKIVVTTFASAETTIEKIPEYKAKISPESANFAEVAEGYEEQSALEFTIKNTGMQAIDIQDVQLMGTSFEIGTAVTGTSISSGQSVIVSVKPRSGLPAGTYTDTLTVTGSNGISLTADLSFTVTAVYTATINTRIDGSLADIAGSVELCKDASVTATAIRAGEGIYEAKIVLDGVYKIYVNNADTGKVIEINGAENSVTIDYYHVAFKNNYNGEYSVEDNPDYTSQLLLSGSKAEMPEAPRRNNYVFGGWYKDVENEWNFSSDAVEETTTLYAKWTEDQTVTYYVVYEGNGADSGNVPEDWSNYKADDEVFVKGNIGNLIKDGYIFEGWTDGSTSYAAGDTLNISSNIVLKAVWRQEVSTYTATYSYNYEEAGVYTTQGDIKAGSVLAKPENDPARNDYTFIGWYKDEACMIPWNFKSNTIAEDITLYAKWEEETYVVEGNVEDDDSNTEAGAEVEIFKGNVQIGTTAITDENGHFTVSGVPSGVYNLVVTKDDQKVTVLIVVSDEDYSYDGVITLPKGRKNSVLKIIGESTPPVVVGYLNELFDENDNNIVNDGGIVEILLMVQPNTNIDGKAKIEAKMNADGYTSRMLMDIDLIKTSISSNGYQLQEPMNTASNLLKLVIPLPEEFQGKDSYAVYRSHDHGNGLIAETITTSNDNNAERIEISSDKTYLTLYAKHFSTYAIGFTEDSGSSGGSSRDKVVSYKVNVSVDGEGGSISPNGTVKVKKGEDITFKITPEPGFIITDVLIDGKSVGSVDTYTFSDVTKEHTIKAVFTQENSGLPYYYSGNQKVFIGFASDAYGKMEYIAPEGETVLLQPNPKNFIDISNHWGKEAINFVAEREIFIGIGDEIFSPDTGMTRGMFSTVVGRLYERSYGSLEVDQTHMFTDCDYDSWYGPYVDWCSENGIIKGIGGGLFQPDREITRQEMVSILYRFSEFMEAAEVETSGVSLSYTDAVEISSWALEAVKYGAGSGIVIGRDDGRFEPQATATRAEVSMIIKRFVNEVIKSEFY